MSKLERIIASLLVQKKMTLAVAESCTGGLLSHRLTNIPGSSKYYECGIVSYSNRAKVEVLGISGAIIEEKGAVSEEVAREMALRIRELIETDLGISITGIAGPQGGSLKKPVGLVYVALSSSKSIQCRRFVFSGERKLIKWKSAQAALNMLREYLERET